MSIQSPAPQRIVEICKYYFGLAQRFMDELGSVDPYFSGVRFPTDGRPTICTFEHSGDFRQQAVKLVNKILKKFPYAVMLNEAWIGRTENGLKPSDQADRTEAVTIMVYTSTTTWCAMFTIDRSSGKAILQWEEPSEQKESMGRLSREADADLRDSKSLLKRLKQILTTSPEALWRPSLHMFVNQAFDVGANMADYQRAMMDPDASADRVVFMNKLVERRLYSWTSTDHDGNTKEFLLMGVSFSYNGIEADSDVATAETAAVISALRDLGPGSCAPDGFFPIRGIDVMPSVANVLLMSAVPAIEQGHTTVDLTPHKQYVDDAFDYQDQKDGPFAHYAHPAGFMTLPFVIEVAGQNPEKRPFGIIPSIDEMPNVVSIIEAVEKKVQAAIPPGSTISLERIDLLNRAASRQLPQIMGAIADAGSAKGAVVTHAEIVPAYVQDKSSGFFAIYMHRDSSVLPMQFPMLTSEHILVTANRIKQAFQAAGVADVRLRSEVVISKTSQTDLAGGPLTPTMTGEWVSALGILSSDALEVLRSAPHEEVFLRSEETDDQATLALPYPHRVTRFGLSNVFGRRYSSAALTAIKDAFKDPQKSLEESWRQAGQSFPSLGRLMETMPNFSRMKDPLMLSMQLAWTKMPTVRARAELLQRLDHTDIGKNLPASTIQVPYPFFYVHFDQQPRLASNQASPTDEEAEAYSFVGAFVRLLSTHDARKIEITSLIEDKDDALAVATSTVTIALHEDEPLVKAIDRALSDAGYANDDLRQMEAEFIEMLLKVLYYMATPEARKLVCNARADALKDISKRTPERKERMLRDARGLYDHILVGPTTGMPSLTTGTGRQITKVFVRRGHINHYWVGKGRTQVISKIIDPVVVNRHLLAEDEEVPAPKNYIVH